MTLREASIYRSPHALNLSKITSEEEKEKLYNPTRIDESYKPYTVIDVLQKVFHRSFVDDLTFAAGQVPEMFQRNGNQWPVASIKVKNCRIIRPESIFQQPLHRFRVDILVKAVIEIEEVVRGNTSLRHRYSVSKELRLRYRFNFVPCVMSCYLEDLIFDEKYSLITTPNSIPMNKYLLPVMRREDYDRLAEWLLRKYLPEYYGRDISINIEKLVERMGLAVIKGVFPENGVLGEFFFDFGIAEILSHNGEEVIKKKINPGTIIVNEKMMVTPGSRNSTIAHEGSHMILGVPFYMLQKTHGHDYCSYMCKRQKSRQKNEYRKDNEWTPVDIMEIQANTFPRYFMIQKRSGMKRAERLLEYYGGIRDLETMNKMIDDFSNYYGVTKTMARSRLIDFGYKEARGIMQSANGGLVPSYISRLADNQTYTVSEKDAIAEYKRNPEFRNVINSGSYLYVEGHYCINHEKYIGVDHFGVRHLTYYAREHMEECCLVFSVSYQNLWDRVINGVFQKGVGRGRKEIHFVGRNGESPVTEEGKKLREQMEKELFLRRSITQNFNQMTVSLMKKRKISIDKLSLETGLSYEVIRKMRNDSETVFSIRSILAVCFALHLPPALSMDYIKASPSKFQEGIDMMLYQYALNNWYNDPVKVVNRKLVEAGARPLTNLVDGYGEDGVKLG